MVDTPRAVLRKFVGGFSGHPDIIGLIVALVLAGHVYGSGAAALLALFAMPYLILRPAPDRRGRGGAADGPGSQAPRDQIVARLDGLFGVGAARPGFGGCLAIGLDDVTRLIDRLGHGGYATLVQQSRDRIRAALRGDDLLCQMDGGHFVVALAASRRTDAEALMHLGARLRAAVADPGEGPLPTLRLSCSIGVCPAGRAQMRDGAALLAAAELALRAALARGQGQICAYSREIEQQSLDHATLGRQAGAALDDGQIVAWFQPQVSTHTGQVTGFEALARWVHPQLGLLGPGRFLPVLADDGLMVRLSEVMLLQALAALRRWDAAGLRVPSVSVNFSTVELLDPSLADRIAWELDRFGLAPQRLSVEILETVVTDDPDEVVVRNIAALARLGCGIDLDDFGTGHASITSIRRFAVQRLKIDRSLVARVDADPGQRRVVAAILSMAEPLGVSTLGEGVETPAEHAILAQLGCDHVQGYAIARPMPLDETLDWLARHQKSLTPTPIPGRQAG